MANIQYTAPNQKIITIHKATSDKNHLYGIFNQDALFSACRNLTGNELKLYLYLCCNQPEYRLALSPKAISEQIGAHEDSIRTAVQGLIKKGYLACQKGNLFNFYEAPNESSLDEIPTPDKTQVSPRENTNISPRKPSNAPDKTSREIIQKQYMNNKTNYSDFCLESFISNQWKEQFKRIKVNFYPHTLTKLTDELGKEPDVKVVTRIITENWSTFENALWHTEGYRFSILLKLLKTQYSKWESYQQQLEYVDHKTPEERKRDLEYLKAIRQRGDYTPPKKDEHEIDILALMEEVWPSDENAS